MSISSKLAIDFVKRNFKIFNFTYPMTKVSEISDYNVHEAHVRVNGADIELFDHDSCCTSCVTVKLPESLRGKLSLEDALRRIDKENLNMESYIHGKTMLFRVTTNRLLMLEKLLKKSGLFKSSQETFRFDTSKAMIEDESGNTVEALNQANLSDIEGVIIDGVKYYPALDVEKLCYKADKMYTEAKKEYDKIKTDYEKAYLSLDPNFIEAQSKMMKFAKDLSVTSVETINTIIDKLTEMCKK